MHEMSLCEGMIRIIEAEAARQDFARVKTVWLELGELSHAEPEAMAFCFSAAVKGTIAEGAGLEIIRTPGEAFCLACAKTVAIHARHDPCPACGGFQLRPTGGDAMRLRELEVE